MKEIKDVHGLFTHAQIRDDGTIVDKYDLKVFAHIREDGTITDKFDLKPIAHLHDDGTITDEYDIDVLARLREDGTITDKYDIDELGKIKNNSNPYQTSQNNNETSVMDNIVAILFMVVKWFWYILLFYWIPLKAAATFILSITNSFINSLMDGFGFNLLAYLRGYDPISHFCFLTNVSKEYIPVYFFSPLNLFYPVFWEQELASLILSIIVYLVMLSALPYMFIIIKKRINKEITLKKYFSFILWWFLIGPFAYIKLFRKTNSE